MKSKSTSQNESVTYGSIVSFRNEFKLNDDKISSIMFFFSGIHLQNYNKQKEDNILDFLKSGYFLYSQGIFNEFCYLYSFKDDNDNDIKYNYINTLFMILPACEYEAMIKLKNIITDLKNEMLMDEKPTVNNFQIFDFYIKFRQEIFANLEKSSKLLKKWNNKVNFNDCVQFLHIKTGKFLCYKSYDGFLKTYIELTDNMSKNTIFRFTPTFNYQTENSTSVFYDLTIQIACGEKTIGKEKFVSYIYEKNKNLKPMKRKKTSSFNNRVDNLVTSIKNIFFDPSDIRTNKVEKNSVKDNFFTYLKNSNFAYKNFGKKILPNDKYIGVNVSFNDCWKLVNFSKNFLVENKYINSLDYFCIQNVEKNMFISIEKKNDAKEDNINNSNYEYERKGNLIYFSKRKIHEGDSNNKLKNTIKEEDDDEKSKKEDDEKSINEENQEKEEEEEPLPEKRRINIFNEEYFSNLKYDLKVENNKEDENNFLEPYSLFKFEIIDPKNEKKNFATIDLLSENCYVRIISVFLNKAISLGSKLELQLINNVDKNDYRYGSTLFKVEKVIERNKATENEKNSDNENEKNKEINDNDEEKLEKSEEEEIEDEDMEKYISKNSYIKIRTKIGVSYIGIRIKNLEGKESKQLLMTKSISDLTTFKLNYLDEEDKYELNFFEQLLSNLKNVLTFFRQEKTKIKKNTFENIYEKIHHLLIIFKKKIKDFKENRHIKTGKEKKFDFMKMIKYFNITELTINLFIANWFNECRNFDYDQLEEIIINYFTKENPELKYKQIISRKILKILTLIFDLDKSYLNCISGKLLYFFMFVGRDDKCTKFLVHILKDNRMLLISLYPTNIDKNQLITGSIISSSDSENLEFLSLRTFQNLKKCLKRIINDYNHLNLVKLAIYFSSIFLFFKLLNCLLVYKNKPFKPFYDCYFEDLNLLVEEGEYFVKPDYINNPILVGFQIKNGTIYVRKEKFFHNSYTQIFQENYLENDEESNKTFKSIYADSIDNNSGENEVIQFKLIDLIKINNNPDIYINYKKIIFIKLVSLNIFFYSNLSLCDSRFKAYLKSLFNIKDVIGKYLSIIAINDNKSQKSKKKLNINLNNDLKCSLVQLINYLYFRIPFPFWERINLFKNFNQTSQRRSKTILDKSNQLEKNDIEEEDLYNIITYINEVIENNIKTKETGTDPFLLFQIFECAKYTLRFVYTFKNNDTLINSAFNLMGKILRLLDKCIGLSKDEKINMNLSESLSSVLNDKLILKEHLFIVNDKFQLLFQKVKKKLENAIKTKEGKKSKELFKDLFFKATEKEYKIYSGNMMTKNLKRKSMLKLKKYNISQILFEISINSNMEQETFLNEIMLLISTIFLEFLKYIESLSIDELGLNLFELKKAYTGKMIEFERIIVDEIVKTNNENYKKFPKINEKNINTLKYRFLEFKESSQNKYMKKFLKQWNNVDDISNFFFKFLKVVDNKDLVHLIVQIIYKLNNQRKIYYRNVCNYVIFQSDDDFEKFLKIKQLFLFIFENIENINLLKRLDKTTYTLLDELNFFFKSLIKALLDEKKWRKKNNILNSYEEIDLIEDDEDENSITDFEIESLKFEEDPNSNLVFEKIKSAIKGEKPKKVNKHLGPYLIIDGKEAPTINLLMTQQTLYNLGFLTIINDFFKYIQLIIDEKRSDLKDDLSTIELTLISLYKLMVLFIYNNSKHKKLINDQIYLYLYPLKLKNKKVNLVHSIGYFLLNALYNYNFSTQKKITEKTISILNELNDLDWHSFKNIIPYFIESFKMLIIKFGVSNYSASLFQVINKILETLIKEVEKNNCSNNDILSIGNILEFVYLEQDKRIKEENRNPIINLEKLVNLFVNIIKVLIPETLILANLRYSKILVLVTNIISKYMDLYKNDFYSIIKYNANLSKSLFNFCSKLKLNNSLIYVNNNINLKYFNEFIGISIPKLYLILLQTDKKNNLKSNDKDKLILNVAKNFYQIILDYMIPKKNNAYKQEETKLFITKNNKDEILSLLKIIDSRILKFMKLIFDSMEKNEQFYEILPSIEENKNDEEIMDILDGNFEQKLEFVELWNRIKLKIIYQKGLVKFHKIVKDEITNERKNFVKSLINYNKNIKWVMYNILDKNLKDYNENINHNASFFYTFSKYFINYYGNDLNNNKNELYFYYWLSIFLMEYNEKNNYFDDKKTKYNKEYFNKDIINFTLKQFHDVNFSSINYENLLCLKFFNSYLCELNDKAKEECLNQIINSQEAENIFNLLRCILDKLSNEIKDKLNKAKNLAKSKDIFKLENINKIKEDKKLNFPHNLFENELDEYIQALDFLSHFSQNNQKMKDYLRYQNNNNSKNHNFIVLLSSIIECFVEDNETNNKSLIEKYFDIIIKIIETLTNCCNRASNENQDCIINETNFLGFTKYILDNITYRQKKYFLPDFFSDQEVKENINNENIEQNNNDIDNNFIECLTIGLDRKKLSYLKYKLLFFLSILTIGREKEDKIYGLVNKIIDFNTLVNIIVETYKEILLEKNCQNNPESLNFNDNMLFRYDNPEYQNLSNWDDTISDENFIIFEIGTYAYLLINIYLEKITKPNDISTYKIIKNIRNELKIEKCKDVEKNIFEPTKKFFKCFIKIFKNLFSCNSGKNIGEDFFIPNAFAQAYKLYFEYTPEIEIIYNGQIIKYFIKLSPISKCLTGEMKEDFNKNLDRSSTKTKIESLFNNVEYLQHQLNNVKNRMDLFHKYPAMDLWFNQYNFFMDVFYIIAILVNLLIFCSYYRTNDDTEKVKEYSEDFEFRYGFLYRKNNINITEEIIFYLILIETIFGALILINYAIIRIPYLTFYKNNVFYEDDKVSDENEHEKKEKVDEYFCIKKIISLLINIFRDGKLIFHLLLFLICLLSIFIDYRFITGLLIDVINKSKFLMMVTIVVWESKMQLLALMFLFYLIAYYLIIFIYLFIPDQASDKHCFSFMECYFTLCDQTIKNSNGVINYLSEEGLYLSNSLWVNVRFYIDNIFAILEYFIVLQIFTAIIIIGFTVKTKEYSKVEKDRDNKCFICGLQKSEITKYYNQLEFNGHIKLDHNLWNYMFAIINVMKKDKKNLISLDKIIYENYKKRIFKTWIPYKTFKIKNEEDMKKKNF